MHSCRAGTVQMYDILRRITSGEAGVDDLEMLKSLCELLRETSLCGLGQTAQPVLSTLKYFPQEYESHIRERRCPRDIAPWRRPARRWSHERQDSRNRRPDDHRALR